MTAEQVRETADVVTGTFLVNSLSVCMLFDSGTERSFVSMSFFKQFTRSTTTLTDALVIEVANGEL